MYTDIILTSDSQQLACKEFIPEATEDLQTSVVFIHGFTSGDTRYIPLAESLRLLGFTGLTVNLRGHNGSPYPLEHLTRTDHLHDIYAAYTYMRTKYPSNKLGILAKSYGAYLTLLSVPKLHPDFLMIVCPALYPDADLDRPTMELIRNEPDIFRQNHGTTESNAALQAIHTYTAPIAFITAGNDEEIPTSTTGLYRKYLPSLCADIVIPDANHSFTQEPWTSMYHKEVISWLTK